MQVTVMGIDGSGKSLISASLAAALAAELGLVAGSAGDAYFIYGPDEDHLAPSFYPQGFPLSGGLSMRFKRWAKRWVDRRKIYPVFKLAQMICQDSAAQELTRRYGVQVMVSDGNVLLSATGRAANYRRPASEGGVGKGIEAPRVEDLAGLFAYMTGGKPLSAESAERLPPMGRARRIDRWCRVLGLSGVWLPDAVVFLDIPPRLALQRIAGRHQKVDRHENEADLAQAREMYLKTLEAFQSCRPQGCVLRIETEGLTPGQMLRGAIEGLRPRILAHQAESAARARPLGTSREKLTATSVWTKVFNGRYIFRYLLPKFFDGAWREPFFILSRPGRIFLKEGYSAGVMRVIYDRSGNEGILARIFHNYPLHRAVYDRLQILTRKIEAELAARLSGERSLSIFTAPSGFAYDLFRPLQSILHRASGVAGRVEVLAADLDPHGVLAEELSRRALELGVRFRFLRGDLTSPEFRSSLGTGKKFDLVLFVGLSSWLPKTDALRHLTWLRTHLHEDGLLVTDCFTAAPYALSGRFAGYKAQYYTPDVYRALVDYCGFDGVHAEVESGRDRINHVLVAKPRPVEGSRAPQE